MTGYGRANGAIEGGSLTVQISSVNRRNLDLSVLLPPQWAELEGEIAEAVRAVAERGKVHVKVEAELAGAMLGIDWDNAAVADTLQRLEATAKSNGVTFAPDAGLVWQLAVANRQSGRVVSAEAVKLRLLEIVAEALAGFVAMRGHEGDALLADFTARLETLQNLLSAIASRAPQVAPKFRELLLKRLAESGLELNGEDERVLKEIAFFADRCDVTEELTRLRSHLEQLGTHLRQPGALGRKAEFILQEIGREVNTVGSKANDLEISRAVIEMKNELERVREQMANVE